MPEQLEILLQECKGISEPEKRIKKLNKLIKSYPKYLPFYFELADSYKSIKDDFHLEKTYSKALEFRPRNKRLLKGILELHFKAKKYHKCKKNIKLLLSINSNDNHVLLRKGQIEKEEGNTSLAIDCFKKVIDLRPPNPWAIIALCQIYYERKDYVKVSEALEDASFYLPKNYHLTIQMGLLYRRKKEYYKAALYFRLSSFYTERVNQKIKAKLFYLEDLLKIGSKDILLHHINDILKLQPDNSRALLLLGKILVKEKKYSKAIITFNKILEKNEKDLISRIELFKIYKQLGEVEKAKKEIESLLLFHENHAKGLMFLAQLNETENNLEVAYKLLIHVVDNNPEIASGYCALAQFLVNRGEHKRALRILAKAKAKAKNNIQEVNHKLININLQIGNLDYAKILIEELLDENPKDEQAQINLVKTYIQGGDFEIALKVLNKILSIDEDRQKIIEGLKASIFFLEYKYDASETSYRKIIAISPNAYHEKLRLALILLLKGKIEEANQQLEIATNIVEQENSSQKRIVPLMSHSAKVINAVKMNPRALSEVQQAHQLNGKDRILRYSSILKKDPTYFGAALYMANDIRAQGILSELRGKIKSSKTTISIPKSIVQYWDEISIPKEIAQISRSWRRMNPAYEYRIFSRQSAFKFIEDNYSEKEVNAFKNCEHPAMQADFFRLAYLNKKGGFYADADDKCLVSLDNLSNIGAELIVKLGDFGCFGNNFLACIPENKFINYAFEQAIENLSSYYNEGPWFKLGPGHLTTSICYKLIPFLEEKDYNKWPKFYALTQSEARKIFAQHLPLSYKKTDKSWFNQEYKRQISNSE